MIHLTYVKEKAPESGKGIRFAIYQGRGQVGTKEAVEHNLTVLEGAVKAAKKHDAHLVSFSELYLTGYSLEDDTYKSFAEAVDGVSMTRVAKAAKDNGIAVLCPYPEIATVAGKEYYYDSMALFAKDGSLIKNYRKAHLWGPVEKAKWTPGYLHEEEGEAYEVLKVNDFPIGLANCYEAEFPELTRIFALKGAKLVIMPTAADQWEWVTPPDKDEKGLFVPGTGTKTKIPYPDVSKKVLPVHAQENNIFVAYSNGYGAEMMGDNEMMDFLGNSIVADPYGHALVAARKEETLLVADCIPGDYGSIHPRPSDYLANRRVDLYKELVAMQVKADGGITY